MGRVLPRSGQIVIEQSGHGFFQAPGDAATTGPDEVLNLKIDRRTLVIGCQSEVTPITDDLFAACKRVTDLGCRPAIHVSSIQNREDCISFIDEQLVAPPDLLVQTNPRRDPLNSGWHHLNCRNLRWVKVPRIKHVIAEPAKLADDVTMKQPSRLRKSKRSGKVNLHVAPESTQKPTIAAVNSR